MIAALPHLRFKLNNVCMTLMMVAPMPLVMLVAMRSMFPSRAANVAIDALAIAVFAAGFVAMRTQAATGDAEFVRSMIPHHSGAILMCREARLSDPEIVELCRQIVRSQAEEIAQMEAMLRRWSRTLAGVTRVCKAGAAIPLLLRPASMQWTEWVWQWHLPTLSRHPRP